MASKGKGTGAGTAHEAGRGMAGRGMAGMTGMRGMKCCKDGKVSQPSGRGRGRSSKGGGY